MATVLPFNRDATKAAPEIRRYQYVVFKEAPELGTFKVITDVKDGLCTVISAASSPICVDTLRPSIWITAEDDNA